MQQSKQIIHPNDPRSDGRPLTIITKRLGRVEAIKRRAEMKKAERPFKVEGSDQVVWRRPEGDAFFYIEAIAAIATGWLNAPDDAPFTGENLWLLFDEKWDVEEDGVKLSFPMYILKEWSLPETTENPTLTSSATL